MPRSVIHKHQPTNNEDSRLRGFDQTVTFEVFVSRISSAYMLNITFLFVLPFQISAPSATHCSHGFLFNSSLKASLFSEKGDLSRDKQ